MDQTTTSPQAGEMKTVAVTGATGFVGRHVVGALLQRGYRVRALARDAGKAAAVLPEAAATVAGDINDAGAVGELVAGCGAAVHLVGIIREGPHGQTFGRMHVQATRNVVDACEKAGVNRYLHMSAFGSTDEGKTKYHKTKFEAETIVRGSGLDWTIFRPSLIHGAEGEFSNMMAQWARGQGPMGFMPYFQRAQIDESVPFMLTRYADPVVAPVFVEDVGECFAAAIDNEKTIGEVYHLTGPEAMSMPELYRFVRANVPGGKPNSRVLAIPGDIAAMKAMAAEHVGLGQLLPFDSGMAIMGGMDMAGGNRKAEIDFDRVFRPFTQTFLRYAPSMQPTASH